MKTSFLYQFIAYPFLDCNEKKSDPDINFRFLPCGIWAIEAF